MAPGRTGQGPFCPAPRLPPEKVTEGGGPVEAPSVVQPPRPLLVFGPGLIHAEDCAGRDHSFFPLAISSNVRLLMRYCFQSL
jgi:hypothetical protein